jgi:aquaporin Z
MHSVDKPGAVGALRSYAAEFIGTFFLVFGGVGTGVLAARHVGFVGVALAFGFVQLVLVYAIGAISGCHINPAVTMGQLVTGRISVGRAVAYWLAQFAGGLVAGVVLYAVADSGPLYRRSVSGLGANGWGSHSPSALLNPQSGQVVNGYGLGPTIVIEVLLTGLFVFVVLCSTDLLAHVPFAGIAIGLTLGLVHLVALPVDNASINPARSLGVAPWQDGALGQVWAFIVFPLAGGILGAAVYAVLYGRLRRPVEAETVVGARGAMAEGAL